MSGSSLVVGQEGSVLTAAPPDLARWSRVELMTTDTIFDIASLTKVVATTPSVLALWEMGGRSGRPARPVPQGVRRPAFQDVTMSRLLTHSAG